MPLFLAGLGYKVIGVDFRKYSYRVYNFQFVQGDILKLPFKDNCLDAITCISTIEHIGRGFYNDPQNYVSADILGMQEIKRVLKLKGLLILSVPFGKASVNNQQRIYDKEGLTNLLEGFNTQVMRFYRNYECKNRNNYWKEITLQEAEEIDSSQRTECVCLFSGWRK